MLDYYNYIPKFLQGGAAALFKLALKEGPRAIQGFANLFKKSLPELSGLMSKLAKSLKGGEKLTEKESVRLAGLALNFRRGNVRAQKLSELLSALRAAKASEQAAIRLLAAADLAAARATAKRELQQATKQAAAKARERATRQALAQLNASQVARVTELNAARTAAQTEQSAANAGVTTNAEAATLASRWKQLKGWLNLHPKTAVGVPLVMLGTGPGRYITGKTLQFTLSSPESWFGEELNVDNLAQSSEDQEYIMINGVKIPIKKSSEGYYIPSELNDLLTNPTDNVDTTLAGITNENIGVEDNSTLPVINQDQINDIFDLDQW